MRTPRREHDVMRDARVTFEQIVTEGEKFGDSNWVFYHPNAGHFYIACTILSGHRDEKHYIQEVQIREGEYRERDYKPVSSSLMDIEQWSIWIPFDHMRIRSMDEMQREILHQRGEGDSNVYTPE